MSIRAIVLCVSWGGGGLDCCSDIGGERALLVARKAVSTLRSAPAVQSFYFEMLRTIVLEWACDDEDAAPEGLALSWV